MARSLEAKAFHSLKVRESPLENRLLLFKKIKALIVGIRDDLNRIRSFSPDDSTLNGATVIPLDNTLRADIYFSRYGEDFLELAGICRDSEVRQMIRVFLDFLATHGLHFGSSVEEIQRVLEPMTLSEVQESMGDDLVWKQMRDIFENLGAFFDIEFKTDDVFKNALSRICFLRVTTIFFVKLKEGLID